MADKNYAQRMSERAVNAINEVESLRAALREAEAQRDANLQHSTQQFVRAEAAERKVDEYRQALQEVQGLLFRTGGLSNPRTIASTIRTAEAVAARVLARDALRVEQPRPERWHEGMRESYWNTCWAYVNDNDVCIRLRGHDGGRHEPVAESSRHDLRTANWPEWQEDDLAEADALRVEQPRQEDWEVIEASGPEKVGLSYTLRFDGDETERLRTAAKDTSIGDFLRRAIRQAVAEPRQDAK